LGHIQSNPVTLLAVPSGNGKAIPDCADRLCDFRGAPRYIPEIC
jgi:hypothetical protein